MTHMVDRIKDAVGDAPKTPTKDAPMPRRHKVAFLRDRIDLDGLGLELGPHVDPMFRKSRGVRVRYLETRSTETLRASMVAQGRDPALVEEIDYLLNRDQSLSQMTEGTLFDWVASSHVLEHIPDFVGHLAEVGSVLKPGGIYAAIVPDRNLCFDCLKPAASLGAVLQAHLEKRKIPDVASNIDELRLGVRPEGISVGGWTPAEASGALKPKFPGWEARVRAILDAGLDEDRPDLWAGHSWRFDPVAFAQILADLARFDLTPLHLVELVPTYHMDFIAILKKGPVDGAAMEALAQDVAAQYDPPRY